MHNHFDSSHHLSVPFWNMTRLIMRTKKQRSKNETIDVPSSLFYLNLVYWCAACSTSLSLKNWRHDQGLRQNTNRCFSTNYMTCLLIILDQQQEKLRAPFPSLSTSTSSSYSAIQQIALLYCTRTEKLFSYVQNSPEITKLATSFPLLHTPFLSPTSIRKKKAKNTGNHCRAFENYLSQHLAN